jgi:pimeloyl-ACP methyl ester carboxylesterase
MLPMALIEREGVKLFYEDRGGGEPAMVFVHGWTCDHTHFIPQAEFFSPHHRTILVDLRGHGHSQAIGTYDIPSFADDIVWLCHALDLDRPVIVGHSMGGMIAVELAARQPEVVRAVVALDSPFVRAGELSSDLESLIRALEGPGHLGARRDMAATTFGPYDDPELCERIVATLCAPDRNVAAEAFASVMAWNGAEILPQLRVPVLTVTGRIGGYTDASPLIPDCGQLFTCATVGAGHFIQLEVPNQVNAMLERFLEIVD